MGLAELLSALREDAEHEFAQVDQQTREEVAAVLVEADHLAHALEANALNAAEAAAGGEAGVRLAAVRLEAERAVRDAREAAFSAVLAEVRDRLEHVRGDPGYGALLAELIRETVSALPSGCVLAVDSRDEALAADALRALGRGEVEVRPDLVTWGGAELVSRDGRRLRNTLETRFANAEPLLRMMLADAACEEVG